MVQIAVPRELLERPEHEIEAFLVASLRDSVGLATPAFRRAGIPFYEEFYLGLIDRIAAALVH